MMTKRNPMLIFALVAACHGLIACGDDGGVTDDSTFDTGEGSFEHIDTGDREPTRATKADGATTGVGESFGAIDGYNDPHRLMPGFETRYDLLPTAGQAHRVPWTDSYWPKNKGGIAYRWQSDESHTYESPSFEQLKAMSPEQIARLSPAEKYDLYVGSYEYPFTLRIKAENNASTPAWQGYCHGWTTASIHFEEPRPVTMVNPDGIAIPFGSSDIKALLTYFQGEVVRTTYSAQELPFKSETRTVGSLCGSGKPDDPGCYDANPGAFHVTMANMLGLQGQAFGIDADNTREKWNQPVHRYESRELFRRSPSKDAHPETAVEVIVASKVTYTMEVHQAWEALTDTAEHQDVTKNYTYTLELNQAGEIVGGQWILLLEGNTVFTLHETYAYFQQLDDNGDGKPDLTEAQARQGVWEHFDFPDYVWVQDKGAFSEAFEPAPGIYGFIANTVSTRKKLYLYFARLADIHAASVAP